MVRFFNLIMIEVIGTQSFKFNKIIKIFNLGGTRNYWVSERVTGWV